MVSISRNAPEDVKRVSANMSKARTLLGWQLRKWIQHLVYDFVRMIVRPEDAVSWMARYQPRWNELFAESQNLFVLLDIVRTKLMEPMPAALAATLRTRVEAFDALLARLLADVHADVYDRHLVDAGLQPELQDLERRCAYLLGKLNAVVKGVDKLVT